jgi:ABC-type multidrug transport system fused ATPase/permease subunit
MTAKSQIPLRRVPLLLVRLAGKRTIAFLMLGSIAGLGQSYVDIVLSAYLALFISSIGLMKGAASPGLSLLPHGSTLAISLGLLLAGVFRSLFQVLVTEFTTLGIEGTSTRLRLLTVRRLLDASRHRSLTPASDMVQRLSEGYPRTAQVLSAIFQSVAAVMQALGLFAFLVVLAPRESLLGVLGLGVLGVVLWVLGRRMRRHSSALPATYVKLASGLERISRNQLLVRVLRTEGVEYPRLKRQVVSYHHKSVRSLSLANISAALPQASGVVLIVLIMHMSEAVWHTPGAVLLSFLYLFVRLVQALSALSGHSATVVMYGGFLMRSLADVDREDDGDMPKALSLVPEETGLPVLEKTRLGVKLDDALPGIDVRGVSFRYPGSEFWALENFSLSVAPGEHIGITGPSGCGKSTLVQLVLGVLEPTSGSVVVGGRDTREIQPVEHLHIGYVGAEPFLFEGTLEENLRYGGDLDITEDALWSALAAARMDVFVRSLPDKLHFRLGEGGEGLSAGQKQRISLARALLNRPHLVVLDEATANLDNATESEIANGLRDLAGRVTVLVIAHRPGILAHCTRVVRMVAP